MRGGADNEFVLEGRAAGGGVGLFDTPHHHISSGTTDIVAGLTVGKLENQ